jgi:hypothetical protein
MLQAHYRSIHFSDDAIVAAEKDIKTDGSSSYLKQISASQAVRHCYGNNPVMTL